MTGVPAGGDDAQSGDGHAATRTGTAALGEQVRDAKAMLGAGQGREGVPTLCLQGNTALWTLPRFPVPRRARTYDPTE